jgi:hypothetical protein
VRTGDQYQNPAKQNYLDEIENSKKFLVKTLVQDKNHNLTEKPLGFTTVFKKSQSQTEKGFDRNLYLNEGQPYNPTSNHKFRHINKRKWVKPEGFVRS